MVFAQSAPKFLVSHKRLMARTPMGVNTIPAVAAKLMSTKRAYARTLLGRIMFAAQTEIIGGQRRVKRDCDGHNFFFRFYVSLRTSVSVLKPIVFRCSSISCGVRNTKTLVRRVSAITRMSTGFDDSEIVGNPVKSLPVEIAVKSASSLFKIVTVSFPGARPCGTARRSPVHKPSSWYEMINSPERSIILSCLFMVQAK